MKTWLVSRIRDLMFRLILGLTLLFQRCDRLDDWRIELATLLYAITVSLCQR